MRPPGRDLQIGIADVRERARPYCAATINQMLMHVLIRRTELDAWDRLHWDLQSGRRNVCFSGSQRRVDFRVASHRCDLELHSELIGEALCQLVFRALRSAV